MLKAIKANLDKVPKPVRRLVVIGLMPIPGPFDELMLVVAALLLCTVYRKQARALGMKDATLHAVGAASVVVLTCTTIGLLFI